MIQTLVLDAKKLENEEIFTQALLQSTQERRAQIERLKQAEGRRLSAAAGFLLAEAFQRAGRAKQLAAMQKGEYGKPYLPNESFYFNLSHSGEYAVCAFGDLPVGADIQMVKEEIPRFTARILSAEEQAFLQALPAEEAKLLFYRLWARKESVIKWDGRGLRLPLQEISFVKKELYNKEETLIDSIQFNRKQLFVREYPELLPQYALCVCSETADFSPFLEEICEKILKKAKR